MGILVIFCLEKLDQESDLGNVNLKMVCEVAFMTVSFAA
jgi:hypothetical protein